MMTKEIVSEPATVTVTLEDEEDEGEDNNENQTANESSRWINCQPMTQINP